MRPPFLRPPTLAAAAALLLLPSPSPCAAEDGGLVAVGEPPPRRRRRSGESSSLAVVEDIERRVAQAGGNVEGVIVASLGWSTPDDLDLHLVTPAGSEINFQNRKNAGGELDVDMCVHGKRGKMCTEHPVENIVFPYEAPEGRYKVYVQNFNFHPNFLPEAMQVARMQEGGSRPRKEEQKLRLGRERPILFEVLVKVEGNYRLFQGICTPSGKTHAQSNVRVFEFDYFPNAESEERFVPHFEAGPDPVCADFQQKLLEAGRPPESARLEGGRGPGVPQTRKPAEPPQRPKQKKPARSGGGARGGGGRKARAREETKTAALTAVRSSSRDALLSKPNKALHELMRDLGVACRGCLEKGELVDRLMEAAGVGGRDSSEL